MTKIVNSLQNYLDNSKITCGLTIFALLIIFIAMISPLNIMGWKLYLCKVFVLLILAYVIYKIFCTTTDIIINTKDLFTNISLISLRNNMMLSYFYTLIIAILFIYICITLFD
jgi:hypothetical protein